jgi:hypothetical protein
VAQTFRDNQWQSLESEPGVGANAERDILAASEEQGTEHAGSNAGVKRIEAINFVALGKFQLERVEGKRSPPSLVLDLRKSHNGHRMSLGYQIGQY